MARINRTVKDPKLGPEVVVITASRTLKPSDSGKIWYINSTTAATVTLPALTKRTDGFEATVVVGGLAGASDHRLAPQTADNIMFAPAGTASPTAGQAVVFSNATDNVGQYFHVIGKFGTGWIPYGYGTTASLAKA
jgi:hypothetical protein